MSSFPTFAKPFRNILFGCALLATFSFSSHAAGPITSLTVGEAIHFPDGNGDTWCPAWASDGTVFTPSNDTDGFRKAGSSNLGFHRLDGDSIAALHGTTINMMPEYGKRGENGFDDASWKSSGCYAVDGVLYLFVSRDIYGNRTGDPARRQTAQNACLIKSTDAGKTWTRSASENYAQPTFGGRRFAAPYFIQYGKNGQASVDNADKYIYAISNNGFWDNGDSMILGRVERRKISELKGSDWQFYRGGDGMYDKAWIAERHSAKLVLSDPGKLGSTGAVFVEPLDRYFMVSWYYPTGGGVMPKKASATTVWDFYESPKPWGPWTKIGSKEFNPQGYYSPQICPKFTSSDGHKLFAMTAGDFMNKPLYHLTIVPLEIEATAPAIVQP